MKFDTKFVEKKTDDSGQLVYRLEAFVNHKKQGVIVGFKNTPEVHQATKQEFAFWKVEGDPFPNNTYPTDDDAIIALCKKNGRQLKLDKDGKVKKRR